MPLFRSQRLYKRFRPTSGISLYPNSQNRSTGK
nr:MAG TPA: hypothetical protein [Bacteriophage sp.]